MKAEHRQGWLFVSPWVIGFGLLTAGPMFYSLYLSFTSASLLSPPQWIGLENYHRMFDESLSELERRAAQSAFRGDVKKHVDAIASKYIVADYTSDGAVMFVPAEAVFAEIHAYHPEVVNHAQARRVWIVSPTTLMAVLNTARAVLKDVETRKQIHVIKDALGKLAKDFARFDERMVKLATHIRQAHEDAQDVQVSSRKISAHFTKIEHAQFEDIEAPIPLERASE